MATKILIIRFSSIGDIVLTSPVVRCLKKQLPQTEIHFLTKEKHENLLQANPYIDRIHLLKSNLTELVQQLQQEDYDYIVDLHHNLRSQFIKRNLRKKTFTLQKLNIKKWLLVTFKINILPKLHIVDRMMATVATLGIKNDLQGLDHFIPEKENYPLDNLPDKFRKGYVALVLAGTYYTKRLPAEKHLELIHQTDVRYILLGGKNELKLAQQIEVHAPGRVFNLCHKLSLNQSASLVRDARLVVANDTGLMHIAAAFQKKVLSIWGSTTPNLGMTPYLPNPHSQMQKVDGLSCQPCSKIGRQYCPKKHFRCMLAHDTAEMAHWIKLNF
ncbi:glycosyltransferase family 9 protein [Sunxiuqinia sp. sy24]|uniref:glycosyltransferase family 9 protein n=1 Tax=Sunxiuqinia sp. sy24 TaxID=3461495 RepID=UPI0040453811